MAHTRTREEIEKALEIQCRALRSSSAAYDSGEWWEALRLATAVYVIVHDAGSKYQSILKQLGVRGSLKFLSTAFQYSPHNVLRETHLVVTRIYGDGSAEYRPKLDNRSESERLLQFYDWWESELIFRDGGFRLTRKKLVFSLRSQEGGAHFDPEIRDPNYIRFKQAQLTTPFVVANGAPPVPILGAELASMRQIAWELLETMRRGNLLGYELE